jgi:hypothetical protein
MAVIGSAYVVVRAINTNIKPDIERGLKGMPQIGQRAGQQLSQGINNAFGRRALSSFENLRERLEASRVQFRRLSNAARFLGPAITGLVGAIGALGGGLIVLVSAASQASRALIVLPGILVALGQALATTRFLLGGISDAFQAKINAQKGSARADKAEEAALKRLRDARLALKRLIEEEAPRELEQARRRAADAARGAADALLSAERSQRSYNEAQRAAFEATEDLSNARERAKEKLQQLRFELEGAALSEARARLEFEKSRDQLQAVQDLPPNSRARQEAELAFAEAELNLRKAIDNNADLRKEEDAATKAGVEGSEEVLNAKRALAQAQQREADLAIDTARAFERAARAQRDAAEAAADAAAGGRVEQELNRRIAEARERVKEAEEAAAAAAAGGFSALRDAYKDLNDEGIAFVERLAEVRETLIQLRKDTSGPLFIGLTAALDTFEAALPALAPLIEETGAVVGNFADKLSTALFTGEGFETLKSVWGDNNSLLVDLGDAAINLALAFLEILDAASPLIAAFGAWASSRSAQFLADLRDDGNDLTETFDNAGRRFKQLTDLFGTFFEALGVLGGVINQEGGAADTLLGGLQTRADNFLKTLQKGAEDGSLNTLFQGLSENFLLLFDVVSDLGRAILNIGAQEGIGDFLQSISRVIGILEEIGLAFTQGENSPVAALGTFAELFTEFIQNVTDPNALGVFFETLNGLLGGIVEFTGSDAFQNFFQTIGPLIAQVAAFGLVWRSIRFGIEALGGYVFLVLGPAFNILFLNALRGGATIGQAFQIALQGALRFTGIIGIIVSIFILLFQNSEAFRDSISAFFSAIGAVFRGVIDDINNTVQELFPQFESIGDLIGSVFGVVGDILSVTVIPLITGAFSAFIGFVGGVIQGVLRFVGAFTSGIQGLLSFWQGILALFRGDWDGAMEFFGNALEKFRDFFINIFKGLAAPVVGLFNGIVDAWNNTAGKFSIRIPDWVPFIGGNEYKLPQLPRIALAKGGIVPATPGGVLATIGEAGRPERVEPLDPDGLSRRDKALIDRLTGGGAGATINVYPSQGMDERELADLVSRRLAYQMRKGSV